MLTVTSDPETDQVRAAALAARMRAAVQSLDAIWNELDPGRIGPAYGAIETHPYLELLLRNTGTVALALRGLADRLDPH